VSEFQTWGGSYRKQTSNKISLLPPRHCELEELQNDMEATENLSEDGMASWIPSLSICSVGGAHSLFNVSFLLNQMKATKKRVRRTEQESLSSSFFSVFH
jgi:hypothetical protein